MNFLNRRNNGFGNHVAAHNAAKNINQHALHGTVRQNNFKGFNHALLGRAAAHIQKVGRLAAVQLDDVHRRHGQARAIHHAADIALQRHIVQVMLRGFQLALVFLRLVAQRSHFRQAVQRIRVNADFGVYAQNFAIFAHRQRIDFKQRKIVFNKGLIGGRHDLHKLRNLLIFQLQGKAHFARLKRLQPDQRIDLDLNNFFRGFFGNFFNFHTAFGRCHEGHAPAGTVNDCA